MKKTRFLLIALLLFFLTIGCSDSDTPPPELPGENGTVFDGDWPTSTPEEQNMDSVKLGEVMDFVSDNSLAIDSVVVVRNGHIVFEEYPNPEFNKDTLHVLNSVTKSFLSALVGIAIREGHIEGLDQNMTDLFPDRTIQNLDTRKEAITLENILTMRAGMTYAEWAEPYTTCLNDYINALWCNADPVQHTLDLPMMEEPGTRWNYNGATSHLLSALIATFTDTDDALDFAREFLLTPLGITEIDWGFDGPGTIRQGGSGMSLKPRDMARFGFLYLRNGDWNGTQIVPAAFIAEAVRTHAYPDHPEQTRGYGYQSWWTIPEDGIFYSAGVKGQKIYVVPDLDLVVVFTADISNDPNSWQSTMLYDYIIEACSPL